MAKAANKKQKSISAGSARDAAEFLRREYRNAQCALDFETPYQLLIATILSAQCTDERVNLVTRGLFAKSPTAAKMAAMTQADLEKEIQSAGFFRNKAKNILACSKRLVAEFGGEVPQSLEVLVTLPGVGRKTANVVLGTAFGIPSGVVVDTHVARLSARMGLTSHTDAVKIEQDLIEQLPSEEWIDFSHRMIHHGRRICNARKPDCEHCGYAALCPKIGVAMKPAGAVSLQTAAGKIVRPEKSTVRRPTKAAKP